MKPNLVYDTLKADRDLKDDTFVWTWYKDGQKVHQANLATRHLLAMRHPVCPACLEYRGEIVEMTEARHVYGRTYQQCPACKGVHPGLLVRCSCGSSPHTLECAMTPHFSTMV